MPVKEIKLELLVERPLKDQKEHMLLVNEGIITYIKIQFFI